MDSLLEMKYFPEGDPDVQETNAGHSATHPSGSNYSLQRIPFGFARGVHQKIVVAPVAQPESALRNPRQEGEHNADFQAEDDIEDDT